MFHNRYRYKDPPRDREYERERAYPRDNRAYSRERGEFRERDIRDREADDFRYYDGYERDRLRTKGGWGQGQGRGHPDTYYPSHAAPLHPVPPYAQPNRYLLKCFLSYGIRCFFLYLTRYRLFLYLFDFLGRLCPNVVVHKIAAGMFY